VTNELATPREKSPDEDQPGSFMGRLGDWVREHF
jgi:hypothetical protein